MIEAPEARILCRQLNETVRGKKITDVYTQFSPHKFAWFTGSSEEYAEQLSGKTIDHAQSQGGMVEITIGDKVLILTDGVNLRYLAPGSKLPAKHQLLIAFEDESCLVASVRMYGGLMCYDKDAADGVLSNYYLTARSRSCPTVSARNISSDLSMPTAHRRNPPKLSLPPNRRFPDSATVFCRISFTIHISTRRKK